MGFIKGLIYQKLSLLTNKQRCGSIRYMNKDLDQILKQILTVMRKDKVKFVKFCLERGHDKKDIAKALDMKITNLNMFINRYCKE